MKIRLVVGGKEKNIDINLWDLVKTYIVVSATATLIFLVIWVIILIIFGFGK